MSGGAFSYFFVFASVAIVACSLMLVILCLAMHRMLRLLDVVRSMVSHNLAIVELIDSRLSGPVPDGARPDCARPGHFINSNVAPEQPLGGVCCAARKIHLTVKVSSPSVSEEGAI
ncbi:hypothetical protein [Ochrobactrum sp. Marseille-Q0166]|uniref:hypothetical protein n=1 Tax=Ochrobactrum sp. Marseille-Q0166 TaxID=2761105 RepID=UPI0016556EBD|nr:hypothetical protein [Ochrobactrum sp. Marseille-Q0166]MBC8718210.1 hypothetical protein [Ochrobactrum sp. Marseille-Q0166]